jgi:cell division septum initiation protein DivIVA
MAKNPDPNLVTCLDKISELEELIDQSPAPRFAGNDRRIIDIEEIYNLLGDLKVTIPEDVRKAESIITDAANITDKADQYATEVVDNARARAEAVLAEADSKKKSIIAAAQAEAKNIIEEAEATREQLLNEHDIVVEAERRSDLLQRKAEYNAQMVYDNAKTYADGVLGSLMQFLEDYYDVVEVNRKDLGVVPKPDFNKPAEQPAPKAEHEEEEYDDDEEYDESEGFFGLFKRKKKKDEEEENED